MMEGRKGIGENGTVTVGEGGDDVAEKWIVERGPRGGADISPEVVVGGADVA